MKDEHGNCDSCEALMINGIYCHETGCPEAWRDKVLECRECGCEFTPEWRLQRYCSTHCQALAYGAVCDCPVCDDLHVDEEDASENN